jgi:hypothetical protein
MFFIEGMMKSKIIFNTFVILQLLSSFYTYSQSGNAKSLEIGNIWIYENSTTFQSTYSTKYIVVRDTIIFEKKYAVIKDDFDEYYFERADSIKIYFFNTIIGSEYVVIDFSVSETPNIQVDTIQFWDQTRVEVCESYWSTLQDYTTCYTEGIGETGHVLTSHGGGYSRKSIVAAQLNGVKYGDTVLVGIEKSTPRELSYGLSQNYPNPFNPTTIIKYAVPRSAEVQIKVYDVLGTKIKTLLNEHKQAGTYEVEFDAKNLPSGVYFYRLISENYSETKKMLLLR